MSHLKFLFIASFLTCISCQETNRKNMMPNLLVIIESMEEEPLKWKEKVYEDLQTPVIFHSVHRDWFIIPGIQLISFQGKRISFSHLSGKEFDLVLQTMKDVRRKRRDTIKKNARKNF